MLALDDAQRRYAADTEALEQIRPLFLRDPVEGERRVIPPALQDLRQEPGHTPRATVQHGVEEQQLRPRRRALLAHTRAFFDDLHPRTPFGDRRFHRADMPNGVSLPQEPRAKRRPGVESRADRRSWTRGSPNHTRADDEVVAARMAAN